MAGVAGGTWSTTSWGWTDDDCRSHRQGEAVAIPAEDCTHRVWKVSKDGEHKGFVVLPSDTSSTDAFLIATKGFDWDNPD